MNEFNQHGVCMNPTRHDYSVKAVRIEVCTASKSGVWGFGLIIMAKDGSGYCCGVNLNALNFNCEDSAIQAALQVVSARLKINIVKQLDFFPL
jgi:hypothetical protein